MTKEQLEYNETAKPCTMKLSGGREGAAEITPGRFPSLLVCQPDHTGKVVKEAEVHMTPDEMDDLAAALTEAAAANREVYSEDDP